MEKRSAELKRASKVGRILTVVFFLSAGALVYAAYHEYNPGGAEWTLTATVLMALTIVASYALAFHARLSLRQKEKTIRELQETLKELRETVKKTATQ